jgi:hypothetical protein
MQLSSKTLAILKNFSGINQSLFFRKGNVLSTITKAKNMYARAVVEEEFEHEFAIYDLKTFISVVTMFTSPDLIFDSKFVTIKEGRRKIKYIYTEPMMIDYPPNANPPKFEALSEFKLPGSVLQNVMKAVGVLRLPEVQFSGTGDSIEITGLNSQEPTENTFTEVVDPANVTNNLGKEFKVTIKTDCLKMLPGDYDCQVTERTIGFKGPDVHYIMAVNI